MFCENDANCFALSEAIDGAGTHYKIVYGIILGSGVGGGLVIDKKIITGSNGVCLLYTSPSPRDLSTSRMPSSA